jgi:hypothetical protein
MAGWALGAGLVLVVWLFFSIRRRRKAEAALTAIERADSWLQDQGFAAHRVRFSSYTQPAVVRSKGATVLVGWGPRQGEERNNGFVVEVGADGSVEGAILDSNLASWHKSIALEAVRAGIPLFVMMSARAGQVEPARVSRSTLCHNRQQSRTAIILMIKQMRKARH